MYINEGEKKGRVCMITSDKLEEQDISALTLKDLSAFPAFLHLSILKVCERKRFTITVLPSSYNLSQ